MIILSQPFYFIWRVLLFFFRSLKFAFNERALRVYTQRHLKLYSQEGLGYRYRRFDLLMYEEKISLYNSYNTSHIHYFIINNKSLLNFTDGDSFLDAGCDSGREIKEISKRFPKSEIYGFDINESAIQVINAGTKDNPLITANTGNIRDLGFWEAHASESIDHVLLLNVFRYILAPSTKMTRDLRQEIIDNCVRIAKKSVFIMTDRIETPPNLNVEIINSTACDVRDDFMSYFSSHKKNGETFAISSDKHLYAIVHKKIS